MCYRPTKDVVQMSKVPTPGNGFLQQEEGGGFGSPVQASCSIGRGAILLYFMNV